MDERIKTLQKFNSSSLGRITAVRKFYLKRAVYQQHRG